MTPTIRSSRRTVSHFLAACSLVAACAQPALAQGVQGMRPRIKIASMKPAHPMLLATAPKPFAQFSASLESLRDSIVVSVVKSQLGTRYVWGGDSPKSGFDCSGLVRYVMAALHVDLPRTAAQQAELGSAIARDTMDLRPGDLLTFGKTKNGRVSHIAIYIGHGRYVHASSTAGRVIESDINRPGSPLIKRWRGSRRMVAETAADSGAKGGS
jgi:cell wall-associated NlpC family hydrolase